MAEEETKEEEREVDELKRKLQDYIDDTAIDAKEMAGLAIRENSVMGCVHGMGVLTTLWDVEKILQNREVIIRRDFIKAQKEILKKQMQDQMEATKTGMPHDANIL